jgi:hypothetical protein
MVPSSSDATVGLTDGPTLPRAVVDWLLDTTDRGIVIEPQPDGRFKVTPADALTAADRVFLQSQRPHVRAALAYIDRVSTWPTDRGRP